MINMTDIYKIYGETVAYTKYLENLIVTNNWLDDLTLNEIRKKYIKPATNVAKDWLEETDKHEIHPMAIPHIERALDIKLYDEQKNYLLGKGDLFSGRGTGKTTAYCIKLALLGGEPLNLRKPEEFSDRQYADNRIQYARGFFKNKFMDIRDKLKCYGFKVRELKE